VTLGCICICILDSWAYVCGFYVLLGYERCIRTSIDFFCFYVLVEVLVVRMIDHPLCEFPKQFSFRIATNLHPMYIKGHCTALSWKLRSMHDCSKLSVLALSLISYFVEINLNLDTSLKLLNMFFITIILCSLSSQKKRVSLENYNRFIITWWFSILTSLNICFLVASLTSLTKPSTTSKNRKGAVRSPCLRLLEELIFYVGLPLTHTN